MKKKIFVSNCAPSNPDPSEDAKIEAFQRILMMFRSWNTFRKEKPVYWTLRLDSNKRDVGFEMIAHLGEWEYTDQNTRPTPEYLRARELTERVYRSIETKKTDARVSITMLYPDFEAKETSGLIVLLVHKY